MATVVTEARIAQRTEPLFSQFDLRYIREAAARTVLGRKLAERLDRRLIRAELQLLVLCAGIVELIKGELGEDDWGDPVGDLVLRVSPGLPVCHQPRLLGENGARSI